MFCAPESLGMRHFATAFSLPLLLATGPVLAQSMEKAVAKLGEAGAKAYITPIVSGFGANLNAGWFQKTPAPVKYAFTVSAGLNSSSALLKSSRAVSTTDRMRLDTALSAQLIANSSATATQRDSLMRRLASRDSYIRLEGPAITGEEGEELKVIWEGRKVHTGIPGDSVFIPADTVTLTNINGLLDGLTSLTFFAPQINLGTLYGTNVMLRWLPQYESREEIGPVDYFGFGFQHNPAVWFKPGFTLPLDFSVGYSRQALSGTFFKATAWSTGLHISKTFGFPFAAATPYLGAQYEKSSFELEYDMETSYDNVQRLKTTVEGENTYRVTAGLGARVLAINLNADVSYAQNPSFSFGVMIGL